MNVEKRKLVYSLRKLNINLSVLIPILKKTKHTLRTHVTFLLEMVQHLFESEVPTRKLRRILEIVFEIIIYLELFSKWHFKITHVNLPRHGFAYAICSTYWSCGRWIQKPFLIFPPSLCVPSQKKEKCTRTRWTGKKI